MEPLPRGRAGEPTGIASCAELTGGVRGADRRWRAALAVTRGVGDGRRGGEAQWIPDIAAWQPAAGTSYFPAQK